MTIEELHRTVVDGFRSVDDRLRSVDERLSNVDERLSGVEERLSDVDERLSGVDEHFVAHERRFDAIDQRFDRFEAKFGRELQEVRSNLEARIKEEGDTTRRHFDVMVERMEAAVRIVAEGYVHLRTIGDNHEARLQAIEKRP